MRKYMRKHKHMLQSILGFLIVAVFLFPIYWMLNSSFKSSAEIFANPPTFYPHDFYLGNYEAVFETVKLFL